MCRKTLLILTLVSFALASALPASGQGWARTYGGTQDEYLLAAAPVSDGGLLLAGSARKPGTNYSSAWAIRVDAGGAPIWQKAFSGAKGMRFDAALETADGGFALAGQTDSFGAGMSDVFLAKLGADGALQWMRTYGGAADDMASGLAQDPGGDLLVAGFTESYGAGSTDAWILRVGSSGEPVWQRTYGGAQWDYAYAVLPSGGGFIVAGLTYTWGTAGDLWVMKLDSSGAPAWQKNFGSSAYDGLIANAVVPTADGGFALACSTEGFSARGSDFWVLKFSAQGEVQWQKRLGGVDNDDPYALLPTGDGGLVVGGTTFSFDVGQGDMWLTKLDASGAVLWQKAFGSSDPDECWALAPGPSESIFACGYTAGYGAGGSDFLLVNLEAGGTITGACVGGRTTAASVAATTANPSTTTATGPSSSAAGPSASPTVTSTAAEGPLCVPTQTCSLSCSGGATPSLGPPPLSVRFTGNASAPYCAGTPTFSWDFGDGALSDAQSPTHVYAEPGDYTWVLTVTVDGKICSDVGTVRVAYCSLSCTAGATPASGPAPLLVNFSATSTAVDCAGGVDFFWDFGDGGTSLQQNPSYSYGTPGTFTWTLTVTAGDQTCTKTGTVTVAEPCTVVCEASASPPSGPAPLQVAFSASATTANCAGSPSFAWAFGDGETSAQEDPTHTYASTGNYAWTLTVTADGTTCARAGTVTVGEPCTVTCAATVPAAARAGEPVAFSAAAETAHCSGPPTFAWAFGDGEASGEQNPAYAYASAGSYTWTLTVRVDGQTCARTGTVEVSEACALTCEASATPASGVAPLTAAFTGSATATNCAGSPTFSWSFGDGATSTEPSPSHTYATAGTFAWTLTATVEDKTCTRTGTVTVSEPCALECSASASPASGSIPLQVAFTGGATAAHCSGPPAFTWSFGDGSTSAEQNPSHTYAAAGSYGWTLTVTVDGETCSRTGTVTANYGVPGDCDGDGQVSIGEVQKAINMFLGILPVGCGADCNGDGTVSIGEVQKVINGFLGLAASC